MKPPPQFGHTFASRLTQAEQKVHSKLQIHASSALAGRFLLQCSQFGRSSSAISPPSRSRTCPGGLPGAELMARRRIARLDEHQAFEPVVVAAFRDDMDLAHLVGLRSRLAHALPILRTQA